MDPFHPIVGGNGGWWDFENIVNVHVKRAVHCTVNVARGVVVVLFMGKFSRNFEHLLTCVRNYCRAIALKDWWEIGDKCLKFHFNFE